MNLRLLLFACLILICQEADAQHFERSYQRQTVDPLAQVEPGVYPPSWWTGMEMDTIQLLLHETGIQKGEVKFQVEGPEICKVDRLPNPNYLVVTVYIADDLAAGQYPLDVQVGDMLFSFPFAIEGRKQEPPQGLDASDVIYLAMPDRFANGDTTNDIMPGMNDRSLDRTDVFTRHGGDLVGIREHLPYLKDLGVTALWLNPVQENNQHHESYHGYAITDHYRIDPRLGTNQDYRALSSDLRQSGMHLIMDIVLNHCGSEHFLIRDLPDTSWVHGFDTFTRTNFRHTTLMDPYAASSDRIQYSQGWFDTHMPDLNQKHPMVATYLIQQAIWWVEYARLSGFRIDTYPFSDLSFANQWNESVLREYPDLTLFGETWVHDISIQAFFTERGTFFPDGSNVQAITDFQMYYALMAAVSQAPSWTEGIHKVYYVLAQDFMYSNPQKHVIFLDNHDLTRYASMVDGNEQAWQRGLVLLLTMRGIPMIYYGTEIGMSGSGGAFGEEGRKDMPGGWEGDMQNAFTQTNLDPSQKAKFSFLSRLLHLRQNRPTLSDGILLQYIPLDGLYLYFRIGKSKRFAIICNTSERVRSISREKYHEGFGDTQSAYDHVSLSAKDLTHLVVRPGQTMLLELD